MKSTRATVQERTLPILLRQAHGVYGSVMRTALIQAGYDDIPDNGLYVVGGLARQKSGRRLADLISELGMSKQAAGQLVDALVIRGYLHREPDPDDRRRLTIALTERGMRAAKIVGKARDVVDAALVARVGTTEVDRMHRTLSMLIDLNHELQIDDKY